MSPIILAQNTIYQKHVESIAHLRMPSIAFEKRCYRTFTQACKLRESRNYQPASLGGILEGPRESPWWIPIRLTLTF